MKVLLGLFTLIFFVKIGFSQIVESSCIAFDSVRSIYIEDAQKLILREFYDVGSTYLDSIHIPQDHTDTILNALLAVYNASELEARDTVISLFSIHTLDTPTLDMILIQADSSSVWMDSLENEIIPTGNFYVDSLISAHYLVFSGYNDFGGLFNYHIASFISDSSYNIKALGEAFKEDPAIYNSGPNAFVTDGNDITATINADYVELNYSLGWGDCMSGCICRRHWIFKVYYDCSVEFVESYGCQLIFADILDEDLENIEIYPNPIKNEFAISPFSTAVKLEVYNETGQLIFIDNAYTGKTINMENEQAGIYFVHVSSDSSLKVLKLIKL